MRKAVPKGFPYFAVDFGLHAGYAHVIENVDRFPKNFAYVLFLRLFQLNFIDYQLINKKKRKTRFFLVENLKILLCFITSGDCFFSSQFADYEIRISDLITINL